MNACFGVLANSNCIFKKLRVETVKTNQYINCLSRQCRQSTFKSNKLHNEEDELFLFYNSPFLDSKDTSNQQFPANLLEHFLQLYHCSSLSPFTWPVRVLQGRKRKGDKADMQSPHASSVKTTALSPPSNSKGTKRTLLLGVAMQAQS